MALNKAQLIADLNTLQKKIVADTKIDSKPEDIQQTFAEGLADAIEAYVKSGVVTTTVSAGILVNVDASTGIGATVGTGSGTGNIS